VAINKQVVVELIRLEIRLEKEKAPEVIRRFGVFV
jgi:hypothetical protein